MDRTLWSTKQRRLRLRPKCRPPSAATLINIATEATKQCTRLRLRRKFKQQRTFELKSLRLGFKKLDTSSSRNSSRLRLPKSLKRRRANDMPETDKAPLQPQESIWSSLVSPIKRIRTKIKTKVVRGQTKRHMTLVGSNVLIVKKWAIMPTLVPTIQKTSFGLGDLFVDDWV